MACSGCGGGGSRRGRLTGCYCAYCNPDNTQYYQIGTRERYTFSATEFTDGSAPYSLFNGDQTLLYRPSRRNNCLWRTDTPLTQIQMIGHDDGEAFTLEFLERRSGCTVTYTVSQAFDCGTDNLFINPVLSCDMLQAQFVPDGIIVSPGSMFTDCCFKTPMPGLPTTLYATVQLVSGAALCVTGSYPLPLDTYGDDAIRYLGVGDDYSIEVSCGAPENNLRYWSLIADINGCRLDRAGVCLGIVEMEDPESTYDPFLLRFSNLILRKMFDGSPECCSGATTDCFQVTDMVNVLVSL